MAQSVMVSLNTLVIADQPVPQAAWIASGKIRDNITFAADDSAVDLTRVSEVIEACGLSADLASFEAGDQ